MRKSCASCGGEFAQVNRTQRFCSSSCRNDMRTPAYRTWDAMKGRCLNPRDHKYQSYGARGISICPAWRSFSAFFADMGPRPSGLTLDRIDVNGNYEPGNCRWATSKTQRHNQRTPTKLNPLSAILLRQMYRRGAKTGGLCTAFDISKTTCRAVCKGTVWSTATRELVRWLKENG